jgi:hypothetical protein
VREGHLQVRPLMIHPVDEDLSMGTAAKARGLSG